MYARRTAIAVALVIAPIALATLDGCAQVSSGGLPTPTGFDFTNGEAPIFDFGNTQFDAFPGTDSGDTVLDFAQTPTDAAKSGDMAMHPADMTMAPTCDVHSIKVNEVQTAGYVDSVGDASDEWVELYNPCAVSVSMSSAMLTYRSAAALTDTYLLWVFTTETIAAKGYFLVAGTDYPGPPAAQVQPFYASNAGLAAAGGGVALEDSKGAIIDSMGYGTATNAFIETSPAAASAEGSSMARTTDGVDTNNNAADFSVGVPTPGAKN